MSKERWCNILESSCYIIFPLTFDEPLINIGVWNQMCKRRENEVNQKSLIIKYTSTFLHFMVFHNSDLWPGVFVIHSSIHPQEKSIHILLSQGDRINFQCITFLHKTRTLRIFVYNSINVTSLKCTFTESTRKVRLWAELYILIFESWRMCKEEEQENKKRRRN